jgi:hypothetical protein
MKRAAARLTTIVSLWLLLALVAPLPVASPRVVLSADSEAPEIDDYIVDVVELDDGSTVVGYSFPSPPPDPDLLAARQVVERYSASSVVLTDVPAFNWCYGCSATSAAMMFGFYDRNGYPYMYTGPTNGGVCPLTNAAWGNGNMPLSATKWALMASLRMDTWTITGAALAVASIPTWAIGRSQDTLIALPISWVPVST